LKLMFPLLACRMLWISSWAVLSMWTWYYYKRDKLRKALTTPVWSIDGIGGEKEMKQFLSRTYRKFEMWD
jgi:hypothetical protein